ncbi:biopolymer transporter ExbD [Sulfuriroseicoccus oceanibius]|uniref:Biopolymer transporter ExbD n=1 Tax=Sulfuriroseicoccus oceanibius TaxID=2707525 RepID=A0A7T7JBG9_9BACT|nr:biopolymer transporter ExbD [Sulfuriroseicoccus oceanibius]
MRERKSPKLATAQEPGLDISSLIDVSFLLLIYFLVTTTLKPKEVDLGFRLPGEGGGGERRFYRQLRCPWRRMDRWWLIRRDLRRTLVRPERIIAITNCISDCWTTR